jgi:3-methyladenine DNA glycosylase AlkD
MIDVNTSASVDDLVDNLRSELSCHADPARAVGERQYLKSELEHLGVSVPVTRRIVGQAIRTAPALGRDEVTAAAKALWTPLVHEYRLAAALLLAAHLDVLTGAQLSVVKEMLLECGTWALVDQLAIPVAGGLLLRDPAVEPTYRRWAAEDQLWVRRGGILAFVPAMRRADAFGRHFPTLTEVVEPLLDDRRFFVRKAIGWVLREATKCDAGRVVDWLCPHLDHVSGVTMREVTRHLPPPLLDRLGRGG